MKAVFLDYGTLGPGLDLGDMQALLPDLKVYQETTSDQVAERIAGAEIVVANKVVFDSALLSTNPALRFIGLTATGTDNVDVDAAKEAGVAVCNIRSYCTASVAEHVFSVLLYLVKNLRSYDDTIRSGEWQSSSDFCLMTYPIRELSAMTLGVVGHGDLGGGVAQLAEAFGMKILVSARPGSATVPEGRVAFNELIARSDVISLHCPLNDKTRNLFSTEEFGRMKTDAVLINTARGGLVDSAALVAALEDGEIGAAAIDVLPVEPPVNGDPLLDYDGANLIVTPHVAWATGEARQNALTELQQNIEDFLGGGRRNRIV